MERQYVEYTVRKNTVVVGMLNYPMTATDAYVIGRIAADGSYTYNHAKRFIRMGLSAKDEKLLQAFAAEYMPNTPIINRDGRHISIFNGIKTYNYVTEGHREIHFPIRFTEQLKRHGIVCHKPDRVLAGIPDRLFSAAVLGFLDGDGSIIVRHRKDCRTPRLHIDIGTGATTILSHIQKHLERKLGIASSINVRSKSKSSNLRIETTEKAIQFCEWVYSELPEFFCKRKKAVFDRYMSCVRSGENGEGRKDNPVPSPSNREGVETTGLPEVAGDSETAPDTA